MKTLPVRHRTRIVLLALVCIPACISQTFAQKEERNPRYAHLALITRSNNDSVVLRWAPSKPGGWSIANDLGYVVERIRVNTDGSFDPVMFERLTAVPLKPWPLEVWKQRVTSDNHFAAIAAQALYGKAFVPKSTGKGELQGLRNAADEFSNRYSFALLCADNDAAVATGLGLRLVDRNVHAGTKYVYRVFVGGIDPTYAFDTAYAVVRIETAELSPRVHLVGEGLDGRILLRWEEPIGRPYSGYYISRSVDNGKSYHKVNSTPLVTTVPEGSTASPEPRYTDTTIVNYRHYRYQVRGVTPFAELGPPVEVEIWGRDKTPPAPPQVRKPFQRGRNIIEVRWDAPHVSGDLQGFVVARSASSLGGFRELVKKALPSNARSFLDINATDAEPYYIVGAVDTAGNVAVSLPVFAAVVDSLPPAPPAGLAGAIDSNGVVRLRWRLGSELDIVGYRVFRSNSPLHEFAQVTSRPLKDTTYVDTVAINTLSKAVSYRVVAVDNRYNHSDFSPTLVLHRRDQTPPEAPVFKDVMVSDSSVHLIWFPSPSEDVKNQVLSRRLKGERSWLLLATETPSAREYIDRTVASRETYQYIIVAVDSSGLRSVPAMPIEARPYDTGVRARVDSITARYNAQHRSVILSWRYPRSTKEKHYFLVYRATGKGNLMQYRSVEDSTYSMEDKGVQPASSYRYAIKVVTSTGGESTLSPAVQADIK